VLCLTQKLKTKPFGIKYLHIQNATMSTEFSIFHKSDKTIAFKILCKRHTVSIRAQIRPGKSSSGIERTNKLGVLVLQTVVRSQRHNNNKIYEFLIYSRRAFIERRRKINDSETFIILCNVCIYALWHVRI